MLIALTLLFSYCLLAPTVQANAEKTVFVTPAELNQVHQHKHISLSSLPALTDAEPRLRLALPRTFADATHPHGTSSWYHLPELRPNQRYEVRVCWSAIEPTEFTLETFTLEDILDSSTLSSEVQQFAQQQAVSGRKPRPEASIAGGTAWLFLRVQSAAEYFSSDPLLMQQPPPVHVDLILDPYLLNAVPASLPGTAAYLVCLAVLSWFASGWFWHWLAEIVLNTKPHVD